MRKHDVDESWVGVACSILTRINRYEFQHRNEPQPEWVAVCAEACLQYLSDRWRKELKEHRGSTDGEGKP